MTIGRWLRPPVFVDEETTHQAFLLHAVLWTMVLIPVPYVVYTVLLDPANTTRALMQAALGESISGLLLWAMRAGAVRWASIAQVGALWAFMTVVALTGGALQGQAYQMGYPVVIVIAGGLLGFRWALAAVAASVLAGTTMLLAQGEDWAPVAPAASSGGIWIVSVVTLPIIAVVQYLAQRSARRALALARDSEQRYRSYVENSPHGVFLADAGGRFVDVNPAATEISGRSRGDLLRVGPADLAIPEEQKWLEQHLATTSREGRARGEGRLLRADGEVRDVSIHTVSLSAERLLGFVTDITARKAAQRSLRESEERFRTLAEAAFEGIMIHDRGVILEMNETFARLFGYESPADLVGVDGLALLLTPDSRALIQEQIVSGAEGKLVEVMGVRRDGSTFHGETQSRSLEYKGRRLRVVAMRDVSDRVRAQQERSQFEHRLAQVDRLETAGRLAGGVAHDFNNLLNSIVGNAQLLLRAEDQSPSARNRLGEIERAGESAARLTRQLLAIGRRQAVSLQLLDVDSVILYIQGVLERLVGTAVALDLVLAGGGASVRVDLGQIEQILVNLCVNARDATPPGGRIEVRTGQHAVTEDECRRLPDATPRDYVTVTVSDTGTGMTRETLEHVFEPFFTTKAVGEGTGLGLSTVYGIVRQNGGFIAVSSTVGVGTRFDVYLPRAHEETS